MFWADFILGQLTPLATEPVILCENTEKALLPLEGPALDHGARCGEGSMDRLSAPAWQARQPCAAPHLHTCHAALARVLASRLLGRVEY